MTERSDASLGSASERLARSRAELQRLLERRPDTEAGRTNGDSGSAFPRSVIMKAITKHGGATGLALFAVALFAAKPRLAVRLMRYLPVSAISKALIARFIDARQAKTRK